MVLHLHVERRIGILLRSVRFFVALVPLLARGAENGQFLTARPEEVGLKPESVAAFVDGARRAGSDGFAIIRNNRYVAGFGEDRVQFIYSVTKAVTGLAAGRLFTEGKWTDIDVPIRKFLPELAQDPKGAVTLRQLMSHTSGIRDARDENGHTLKSWNMAKDWLAAAIERPMESAPGTVYQYNNQGPALVALAIERTTGERLDRFVGRTIFRPLCIDKYKWMTDRAGHAAGYTGLSISAMDLAKLGGLVIDKGSWQGTRVLSEDWIRQSAFTASQAVNRRMGLFWFIQLEPRFPLPLVIFHSGDGGQCLIILPNHGIVVAMLRSNIESSPGRDVGDFRQLAFDYLVKGKTSPIEPRP